MVGKIGPDAKLACARTASTAAAGTGAPVQVNETGPNGASGKKRERKRKGKKERLKIKTISTN